MAEALEQAVEALRRAGAPATVKDILKWVPAASRIDAAVLAERLSGDARTAQWPGRGKKGAVRFWTQRPEEFVSGVVVAAVAESALTAAELQKLCGKGLAGFSAAAKKAVVEGQLTALAAAGRVFVHPPPAKGKAKYSARPARAEEYVAKLWQEIDALAQKLAGAGITRADIVAALSVVPSPPLMERIAAYLQSKPGGVGVVQLREELQAEKVEFDAAVLALYRARRVHLDAHDWPRGLSDAAREELVSDGAGTYYVVISLRDADAESLP